MNTKLFAAAGSRSTPELHHLLDVIERRISPYRSKVLTLVSVQVAIETELARRAAIYGLTSIGTEAPL